MQSNINNISHENEQQRLQLPCVVLFNGFPGVGKYTIAKAFRDILETESVPHRLVDNHALIDPFEAICPGRNAAHFALRKKFQALALDGLKAIEEKRLIIILTACLAAYSPRDLEQYEAYIELAKSRAVPFVVIDVACSEHANRVRLCSEERREGIGGKTKLIDVNVLETLRKKNVLLDARTAGVGATDVFQLQLDTTELSVEESAKKVIQFLDDVTRLGRR